MISPLYSAEKQIISKLFLFLPAEAGERASAAVLLLPGTMREHYGRRYCGQQNKHYNHTRKIHRPEQVLKTSIYTNNIYAANAITQANTH